MSPRTKVLLIEAGITIGTGVALWAAGMALWAAMEYAPEGIAWARTTWAQHNAPPLPMFPLPEVAVSEFRATLNERIPDPLTAENWGW